jgi:DNA-binding MurR/RpiR family transcriptional regulator
VSLTALIDAQRQRLTPAERRVADVVLTHPQDVAFGTVADVARQASTSGATVIRLAAKLGFVGFSDLQGTVQTELTTRLRPAVERIRERPVEDVIGRTLRIELDNVHATLEAVAPNDLATACDALADTNRRVWVLAGEVSRGIGLLLTDELAMLRPGVAALRGSQVRVSRMLAGVDDDDVVVVVDLRRYERWVVATASAARDAGAVVIALTDSLLSPLADLAAVRFVVRADGTGPFDSHVGILALANTLVAGAAARLQPTATERLDRIEAAWRESGALVES